MLILACMLATGAAAAINRHRRTESDGSWAVFWLCCLLLAMALILWPIHYFVMKGEIQEFRSVQATISQARLQDDIERAAAVHKAVDWNVKLASWQYWNGTVFGDMIPDEVDELEPIR